jgi:Xaa-Pro aminopeptidase
MFKHGTIRSGIVQLILVVETCLVWSLAVWAQPAFTATDRDEFAARRARLLEKIADGVAIVLADEEHVHAVKFRQSPDFYYLTGIEDPGAILLLVGPKKQSFVFTNKRSAHKIKVDGPGLLDVPNAGEVYGLTQVLPTGDFLTTLNSVMSETPKLYVQMTPADMLQKARGEMVMFEARLRNHPLYKYTPLGKQAIDRLRELYPQASFNDINPILDQMRWVKTPYEIERFRRAGHIGAQGLAEAIKGTKPGMYEYEIEAVTSFVYTKLGGSHAFVPIVASGPNTIIWHYQANNRQMQAGDVVLMDTGANVDYYSSDITRTWPVSGRFTPEQEKMYRCILEARRAIIAVMKPGVTVAQMQGAAEEVYKRHGFHQEFLNIGRYVGHYVGLSVHDVGPALPMMPMPAGVVFNVEPILEIPAQKIHVRLEDTIVITPTGAENLTAGVPAEVDEIYALVKQKGISLNGTGHER